MSLFVIKPFEVGEYETDGKVLGSGSFSVVCLGRHKVTHQAVAIKIIKKEFEEKSQRAKKQLQAEISIMQRTSHPNIIKLHAVQRVSIMHILGAIFPLFTSSHCGSIQ